MKRLSGTDQAPPWMRMTAMTELGTEHVTCGKYEIHTERECDRDRQNDTDMYI